MSKLLAHFGANVVIDCIISAILRVETQVPGFKQHVVVTGSSVDQCPLGSIYAPRDIDLFISSTIYGHDKNPVRKLVEYINEELQKASGNPAPENDKYWMSKITSVALPDHVINELPSYLTFNHKYQRFIIDGKLAQPFAFQPHIKFNPQSFQYFDGDVYARKLANNPNSFVHEYPNWMDCIRICNSFSAACKHLGAVEAEHSLYTQFITKYPYMLALVASLKLSNPPMFAGGIIRDLIIYPTKIATDFDIFVDTMDDVDACIRHFVAQGLSMTDYRSTSVNKRESKGRKHIVSFTCADAKIDVIHYEGMSKYDVLANFDFTFNAIGIVPSSGYASCFKFIHTKSDFYNVIRSFMVNRHSLMKHGLESSHLPRLIKRFTRFERDGFKFTEDTSKLISDLRIDLRSRTLEALK